MDAGRARARERERELTLHKVMTVPTLMYGNDIWTLVRKDVSQIHASEMKFARAVKGCCLRNRFRNVGIR